jgi:ATP-dependent Clp protease adaptor protein ClpS
VNRRDALGVVLSWPKPEDHDGRRGLSRGVDGLDWHECDESRGGWARIDAMGKNGNVTAASPVETLDPDFDVTSRLEDPWVTIVWNDPVNLMSYVAFVFRTYFGFTEAKSDELMLAVHTEGRAIVTSGRREEMERHVQAMHEYGLWATLDRADSQ